MIKRRISSRKLLVDESRIAQFYEMEFETNLEGVLSLLQPLLIFTIGVMIGLLLLATLLPMVSLVQQL
jgi:type II secretory pathway component PulF